MHRITADCNDEQYVWRIERKVQLLVDSSREIFVVGISLSLSLSLLLIVSHDRDTMCLLVLVSLYSLLIDVGIT